MDQIPMQSIPTKKLKVFAISETIVAKFTNILIGEYTLL